MFTLLCFNGPIDELETVKPTPLLGTPPTVTTTYPGVAPAGTVTTMLVALQLVGVAAVPLNFTVLVPCVAPKFVPVIVTDVPANPDVGLSVAMLGAMGFPPPPGFEYAPPHPVNHMTRANTTNVNAARRIASFNLIVLIVNYALFALLAAAIPASPAHSKSPDLREIRDL